MPAQVLKVAPAGPSPEKIHSDLLFFDRLVELIPPRFYFPKEERDDWKYRHGKSASAAAKQAAKEHSKKAKRIKLDPTNFASTVDIQRQRAAEEAASKARAADEDDTDGGNEEAGPSGRDGAFAGLLAANGGSSATHAELQARLQSKIQELKGKRPSSQKEEPSQKRQKKNERKQPKEKKVSKAPERKQKLEAEVAKKGKGKEEVADGVRGPKAGVANIEEEDVPLKLDFGRLEVDPSKEGGRAKKGRKEKGSEKKKKLLQQAEALAKDAAKGKPEVQEKVSRHAWEAALGRASGQKVLDDPKLLKKSIKREESLKKKSAKKWEERHKRAAGESKAKQAKRNANIEHRAAAKKERSIAKREKKLMNPGRSKS